MSITVGSKAPEFKLRSTDGNDVSLAGLAGKRFVLYFYPRDNTPGCTKQACDFRDSMARVRAAGVEVYGVSKDSLTSHLGFQHKFGLPFALLTDPDSSAARAYGAFGNKQMYGKTVEGTIRSTFLIGPDGVVQAVWAPVKVEGHVDAVLAAIRGEASENSAAQARGLKHGEQRSSSPVSARKPGPAAHGGGHKGGTRTTMRKSTSR